MSLEDAEALIESLTDNENVEKPVERTIEKQVEYAYKKVTPTETSNPKDEEWYVQRTIARGSTGNPRLDNKVLYIRATETKPVAGKTYYIRYVKPIDQRSKKNLTEQRNKDLLLQKALEYITHNYKPDSFTVKVTAVDMHLIDSSIDAIRLGDIGKVIYDKDGSQKTGTCYAITYHLADPEKNEYTIGDPEVAFNN